MTSCCLAPRLQVVLSHPDRDWTEGHSVLFVTHCGSRGQTGTGLCGDDLDSAVMFRRH